jgi:predicted CXXCH cytochrome family protein
MKTRLFRLLIGLGSATVLALLTFAFAQAQPVPPATPDDASDCQQCHGAYQKAWMGGAHSQAFTDPLYVKDWEAQGKPKECLDCHTTGYDPLTGTYEAAGVTCAACHDPVPANHPLSPATMSRSSNLCGECHRDTQAQWKASKHGQSDLTCVNCHDSHGTNLRASSTSTLCADCHGTLVAAYAQSSHAQQGLTCTDCHITDTGMAPGLGASTHDHSFRVDLNTCNKCHVSDMHNAAGAMLSTGMGIAHPTALPSPEPTAVGHLGTVSTDPGPVSPIGFAAFAGLIGLAAGIVAAPWLERGFRRAARGHRPQESRP